MKKFSEYCLLKENEEKGLAQLGVNNEDELLAKIAQIVINRHKGRAVEFFKSLMSVDPDIKTLFGSYHDSRNSHQPPSIHPKKEKDVIANQGSDGTDVL